MVAIETINFGLFFLYTLTKYSYWYIFIECFDFSMMPPESHFSNIVNPDRMQVVSKAREFANKHKDWGEVKTNIYIAMMQRLAGMGYVSAISSIPDGKYNIFMDISREIIPKDNNYYLGGMLYEKAHRLIIESESFQSISS